MSLYIYKNIYFMRIKFHFLTENNYNISYEGERLLIHFVKPTTKEEKITQYDVNSHKTVLV